jgi:hypothetical protein
MLGINLFHESWFICLTLLRNCSIDSRHYIQKMHVGDIDIAYKMSGSGEPFLFIMGYRGTMEV